jgi:hypothetical protein
MWKRRGCTDSVQQDVCTQCCLLECHDFGTCEIGVLNACASIMALEEGRHVHEQIVQRGFESDVIVGSSLIDMYAKCGSIDHAQSPFNRMPTCNVVS